MDIMMAEQEKPSTEGMLWDAVRAIIAAMKAYLVEANEVDTAGRPLTLHPLTR